ncbi:hypothetical protein O181_098113 [Austropuccinia psidii MF-1]|uniref:Uncharacterized protein n=1 Tax=Austropuccinia psidii MF-1 TaxID=1389203 RepID=A0A9Q3J8M0_9BASI|nr:hypothetical protein [Austropuccinia psidii MF-1]
MTERENREVRKKKDLLQVAQKMMACDDGYDGNMIPEAYQLSDWNHYHPIIQSVSIRKPPSHIKLGFAGGIAGCPAKTFVSPLDHVKILFHTADPHYSHYAGILSSCRHLE